MKTKPFNLERALAGEPVVTRDGCDVLDICYLTSADKFKLVGCVDGKVHRFTEYGVHSSFIDSHLDLFMKAKTRMINGFEVPEPVREELAVGQDYYLSVIDDKAFCHVSTWSGDSSDKLWLERGLIHLDKKSAIANAKAMTGVDPEVEE